MSPCTAQIAPWTLVKGLSEGIVDIEIEPQDKDYEIKELNKLSGSVTVGETPVLRVTK